MRDQLRSRGQVLGRREERQSRTAHILVAALDAMVQICECVCVRATIDLPDSLFRRAKAVSSLEGTTLKEFITRAVEHELAGSAVRLESRRVEFPLVRSRRPGTVRVTADHVASLLEREDLDVPS